MRTLKILLAVLLLAPSVSLAATGVSVPYYTSFEDETAGEQLLFTVCGGFDNSVAETADCDAFYDDEYPARYGDIYLQMACQYDGVIPTRKRAMRAGNYAFEGFRDTALYGGSCHQMQTNNGTEYWIGWSNYIPVGYPAEKMKHSVFQVEAGEVTTAVAYGAFEKYQGWISGSNRVNGNIYRGELRSEWQDLRGTWVDFMFHVIWYETDNTAAKFEYYVNGVNAWDRNGKANVKTGGNPVMVINDYNWAFNDTNDAYDYIEDPDSPIKREVPFDEFRFYQQVGGSGDYDYCDATPPIWGAPPEITYPINEQNNMPTSFTALFGGYEDHRDDLQNCFSYEETQVQVDEYGGDWSTLVFDNTSSASETQMAVSGLSGGTTYQMRVRHNSERDGTTDEYESAEWEVVKFYTSSSTDTTPPTWDSGDGVDHLVEHEDDVQHIGVWFYPCTDAVDGSNVTYRSYYAPTASWDGTTWSNNDSVSGGNIYNLTIGVNYTFGARCSDLSGNEDQNTTTLTHLIGDEPDSPVTVSDISGTFVDGNTVVISGENFGSSGPTVVLFDDFEGGTLGENIETGTDSAKVGDWNARSGSSYYGGASLSGDKSFSSTYANGYANYIEALLPASTRNIYLSWWLFLPEGNNYPGEGHIDGINWKQMWIQGSSTTDDDMVVPSRISSWYINGNESDPGYKNYTTVDFNKGEWKRLSVWLKGSTSSSSNDGEVKFWELTDTGTVTRESDVGVNTLKAAGTWDRVRPNGYGRQTDTCIVSFDDIYIATGANAQARVEIGNATTYAASTELTILTSTDWDDTEISATVNAGTFEQYDNGYLYVTDADGNTSDGFPVTFESTQTATTISGSGTNATTGSGTPAVVGVEPTTNVFPYTFPITLE